jgi:hypothetical protein
MYTPSGITQQRPLMRYLPFVFLLAWIIVYAFALRHPITLGLYICITLVVITRTLMLLRRDYILRVTRNIKAHTIWQSPHPPPDTKL